MVIDESDSDAEAGAGEQDVEGDAYRESLTSVDGFTRGPNGRVKFNKDTKKRRRENEEADMDVDMADADAQKANKKSKRKAEPKFGQEFKAKVCVLRSPSHNSPLTTLFCVIYRRLVGMSKRAAWIPMPTCPSRKPRRSRTGAAGSVSQASAEYCIVALYLYAVCSHRHWIVPILG